MKRSHGSLRIILTEEEAFALEADPAKWPSTWKILSQKRRTIRHRTTPPH